MAEPTDNDAHDSNTHLKLAHEALVQEFGPHYATVVGGAGGLSFRLTTRDADLDLYNTFDLNHRTRFLSELRGMQSAAAILLVRQGHEYTAATELAKQHIATLAEAMHQDAKDAHAGTPHENLITIDEMIALLRDMRTRSPLGGDTVLHWSEHNRPTAPIRDVRLTSDDDGAIVEISP